MHKNLLKTGLILWSFSDKIFSFYTDVYGAFYGCEKLAWFYEFYRQFINVVIGRVNSVLPLNMGGFTHFPQTLITILNRKLFILLGDLA